MRINLYLPEDSLDSAESLVRKWLSESAIGNATIAVHPAGGVEGWASQLSIDIPDCASTEDELGRQIIRRLRMADDINVQSQQWFESYCRRREAESAYRAHAGDRSPVAYNVNGIRTDTPARLLELLAPRLEVISNVSLDQMDRAHTFVGPHTGAQFHRAGRRVHARGISKEEASVVDRASSELYLGDQHPNDKS
ncbi:MAG TPA: hypothetical protein VFL67_20835 [Mycobacterium sp.]|nr:hypothetical protein [Mycobacterium sp.]